MITLGQTYIQMFLAKYSYHSILRHDIVEKDYGYHITITTTYVTVKKIRLELNEDGSAKAVVKVNTNYQAPYQYTLYFDKQGREIISTPESTREELEYYRSLR